jgi:hypothetical protein
MEQNLIENDVLISVMTSEHDHDTGTGDSQGVGSLLRKAQGNCI